MHTGDAIPLTNISIILHHFACLSLLCLSCLCFSSQHVIFNNKDYLEILFDFKGELSYINKDNLKI